MREYPKWRDFLREQLAKRESAIDYLRITLQEYQVDRDITFFLKEVRTVIDAQGGIKEVAKRTAMDPENLVKFLASEKAPRIDVLANILTALGCQLSIEPLKEDGLSTDIKLTGDTEIPKFADQQTQLAESDSTQ